jgi:hypothetical protein
MQNPKKGYELLGLIALMWKWTRLREVFCGYGAMA